MGNFQIKEQILNSKREANYRKKVVLSNPIPAQAIANPKPKTLMHNLKVRKKFYALEISPPPPLNENNGPSLRDRQ